MTHDRIHLGRLALCLIGLAIGAVLLFYACWAIVQPFHMEPP